MRSIARSLQLWMLVGSPALLLACTSTTNKDQPHGADAGADGGECPIPLTRCPDGCVDTLNDPEHCGGCSVVCDPGLACAGGSCELVCPAGFLVCAGVCVNPKTNRGHCGAAGDCEGDNAGVACDDGFVCAEGACAISCAEGSVVCDGACVDPDTDNAHCGASGDCTGNAAGVACADGFVCDGSGSCALSCQGDLVECENTCVDPDTNRAHCGASGDCMGDDEGVACEDGFLCNAGVCEVSCPEGLAACGDACADLSSSPSYCGDCDTSCADGEVCSDGHCCAAGLVYCGGACVDPQSDEANCGGCGVTCPAVAQCAAGACVCPPFTPLVCGAECVNPFLDDANCGGCAQLCMGAEVCFSGECNADPTFRLDFLGDFGCHVVDHTAATGYDHGGIAVADQYFYYTGSDQTARFDALDLDNATPFPEHRYDGIFSDLRTGKLYTLASAGVPFEGDEGSSGEIDSFIEIDPATGELAPDVTLLSETIFVDGFEGSGGGVFAGLGRLVVHDGSDALEIRVADGMVTDHGPVFLQNAQTCNSWAFWGVAEKFGDELYLAYADSSNAVVRTRVSDSDTQVLSQFDDLAYMCNFTFQPVLSRWYFHHQGTSQFTVLPGANETAGYCEAGWCSDAGCFCPPSRPTDCDGTCADLMSDPENCDVCGNACLIDGVCDDGVCGCPADKPDVCDNALCTNVLHDAQNCGMCDNVCPEDLPGCVNGECAPVFIFSGVRTDFPETDLAGWSPSFTDLYAEFGPSIATILNACSGQNLLLACRPVGSPNITVAANAPRDDVTFFTGLSNAPHDANGVGWYFSDDYSWGFAKEGDPLSRSSCDTQAINPEQRLCWHTGGGQINGGWRCGVDTSLNSDFGWERIIYQADF